MCRPTWDANQVITRALMATDHFTLRNADALGQSQTGRLTRSLWLKNASPQLNK
jgi:hypothetical protein